MASSKVTTRIQVNLRQAFAVVSVYCVLFAICTPIFRDGTSTIRGLFAAIIVFAPLLIIFLPKQIQFANPAVVAAMVILFLVLLLPAIQAQREHTHYRFRCPTALRCVGLALYNYHDINGVFPPAYIADEEGRPMHSWRVLLLPYMARQDLFDLYDFDQPWDSASNLQLLKYSAPEEYSCPFCESSHSSVETVVVAITGDGTLWPGNESTSLAEISDGADSTICLMGIKKSGIPWTEPRDLDASSVRIVAKPFMGNEVASEHGSGVNVAFADARVVFLKDTIPDSELAAFFTIAAGDSTSIKHFGRETRGTYRRVSSKQMIISAFLLIGCLTLIACWRGSFGVKKAE